MRIVFQILMCICLLASACNTDLKSDLVAEPGEEMSAGIATIFDQSVNAFGFSAPGISGEKELLFVSGNAFFKRNWVTAPSSTEDLDGLGPLFNARSCSSCHLRDGRGAPPLGPTEKPLSLLFRLSVPTIEWGPVPDEHYGGQFQPNAILGVKAEGDVRVTYQEISGNYSDGTSYSLRKPAYEFTNLNYGEFPADIQVSPRIAPQMIGLGLLESISLSTFTSFADPEDADGDGISGRLNYILNVETGEYEPGRFGWKANQPTVRQQVAGAFLGDIGITSSLFMQQSCTSSQMDCNQTTTGGSPELTDEILDRVVLYSEILAVPARRNWEDDAVLKGKVLFEKIGCESCHRSKMMTGDSKIHSEFSNQVIRPYTDLLLHDMGEDLADHRPDGEATGTEWKTPPLWGIGLIKTVNGHTFLLHDGRARSMEEAILWHDGEAATSNQKFKEMSSAERTQLLSFLESL